MKKYIQFFKMNFLNFFEYRGDLFFSFLMRVGIFTVFILLWKRLDEEGNEIENYGLNGIVFYYLIAQVVDAFNTSQSARDLRRNVIEGLLSAKLVRPFNEIYYFLTKHFARVLSELLINSAPVIPILIIFPSLFSEFQLSILVFVQFTLLAFLASFFVFSLYLLVGLVAFWTKEAHGLQMLVKNGTKFFTGSYIPLDLLPLAFQNFIKFLPFPYVIFFPIKVLRGEMISGAFVQAILILLAWISLLCLVNFIVWRKGLKQYESVGI